MTEKIYCGGLKQYLKSKISMCGYGSGGGSTLTYEGGWHRREVFVLQANPFLMY